MELMAYSLVNMYIKGIQAGIQAAHSQTQLAIDAVKCKLPEDQLLQLMEWQANPIMILKNGGDVESMKSVLKLCISQDKFPFSGFVEPGLGDNVLTSITVILPDVKEVCARDLDGSRPRLEPYSAIEQELFMRVYRMRSAT